MNSELNQTLSGNEVCSTNSLILLVKNMLYSNLHCQKGFNLILFSYKIDQGKSVAEVLSSRALSNFHPPRAGSEPTMHT
jgi:hypothetical protein